MPSPIALPVRPTMPEGRIVFEAFLLGDLHFASQADFDTWKAKPFWRRVLDRPAAPKSDKT